MMIDCPPAVCALSLASPSCARITGCTVHVATLEVDAGPILAQAAVEIRDDDDEASLHERIKLVERDLYPTTIKKFLAELETKT